MHCAIICLVVLAVIAVPASAANEKINATSSIQNYYLLSDRQLRNTIAVSEANILALNVRGADHIKVFSGQRQVVLKEVERVEQSLVPLQALSITNRKCVQKYKPLLLTLDSVKKQLDSCLSTAQSKVNYLASTPNSYLNSAKSNLDYTLSRAIVLCNTTYVYSNQTQELEQCVISNVEAQTKNVQSNLGYLEKYLDTSLCTLSDLTRDAILCAFNVEKNVLQSIGSVLNAIDSCSKENPIPCSCNNSNSTEAFLN